MKSTNRRFCMLRDLVPLLLCSLFVAFFSWKITGCDLHFHLTRLVELADHIRREGLLAYPFAINFSSCEGMGYATPLFYGDLLLLPSAILVAAGIPARIVYALTAAVCGTFDESGLTPLIGSVSDAAGYLLAMTGTCALMLMKFWKSELKN